MVKSWVLVGFLLFTARDLFTQSLYFPPVTGNVWEIIPLGELNWCADKVPELYSYLERRNSKAFILLKDGKIVLEKYFGTFGLDSTWYWASAGKGLTAFLIGMAYDAGKLQLTDKTSQYLGSPWTSLTQEQEDKVTIWHQLTMTSGLDDGVPDPFCTAPSCLIYKADASKRWAYHNAPYTLLERVFEKSMGQSLNSFVVQRLSPTTGITGLFVKSGYNNVFLSTPRAMARFGLLMLANGIWKTSRLLSADYFSQMVQPSQDLNPSYGYLWWLNGKASYMAPGVQHSFKGPLSPKAPTDMYCALGLNGQMINVVPSQNLVWVRMGNAPGTGAVPFTMNDTIWHYLNQIMCPTSDVSNAMREAKYSLSTNGERDKILIHRLVPSDEQWIITIYGLQGIALKRLVMTAGQDNTTIPLCNFPHGLYCLHIASRKETICTERLLIAN